MTATDRRRTFARVLVDAATTRPFLHALLALKHERRRVEHALRSPPGADAEPVLAARKQALAA